MKLIIIAEPKISGVAATPDIFIKATAET